MCTFSIRLADESYKEYKKNSKKYSLKEAKEIWVNIGVIEWEIIE